MLPRSKKLSTKDVAGIIKNGGTIHSPFFILRSIKTEEQTRLAAVASKKIFKTAVERNRIKRLIYQTLREMYPEIISGYNIAIFAKATTSTASYELLKSHITGILSKGNFIKK